MTTYSLTQVNIKKYVTCDSAIEYYFSDDKNNETEISPPIFASPFTQILFCGISTLSSVK